MKTDPYGSVTAADSVDGDATARNTASSSTKDGRSGKKTETKATNKAKGKRAIIGMKMVDRKFGKGGPRRSPHRDHHGKVRA